MPLVGKLTVLSDLSVSFARLLGKTLLLFNRVHWFAKKVLKSLAFSFKFVTSPETIKVTIQSYWIGKKG